MMATLAFNELIFHGTRAVSLDDEHMTFTITGEELKANIR